jgi:hypothetical protein
VVGCAKHLSAEHVCGALWCDCVNVSPCSGRNRHRRRHGHRKGHGTPNALCRARSSIAATSLATPHVLSRRYQKTSLWSWLLGSVSTIVAEAIQFLDGSLDIAREAGESDGAWQARREALRSSVEKRAVVLVHAVFQVRPALPLRKTADRCARAARVCLGYFGECTGVLSRRRVRTGAPNRGTRPRRRAARAGDARDGPAAAAALQAAHDRNVRRHRVRDELLHDCAAAREVCQVVARAANEEDPRGDQDGVMCLLLCGARVRGFQGMGEVVAVMCAAAGVLDRGDAQIAGTGLLGRSNKSMLQRCNRLAFQSCLHASDIYHCRSQVNHKTPLQCHAS